MLDPRWQKVLRDLRTSRGRLALMVVAVAASLFALGTALSASAVLSRELTKAYLSTRPASATIETDAVGPEIVRLARSQPGVAEAEARATLRARVRVGEDWRPLLLFVVPDFRNMRLATFTRLSGEWPPPTGTMLLDHMAPAVVQADVGQRILVKTPNGKPTPVTISGLVWDSSLAPAGMERTAWGYATPETLAFLGERGVLDELKIIVADRPMDAAAIEKVSAKLGAWLQGQGHAVREIQIPPPGRHPHQGQMLTVMLMLDVFSVAALLLSGALVGSTVASMMARQVREIGVMKAIGGGSGQIARLYLLMMLVPGVGALALAMPASVLGAEALIAKAAFNLNLQIESAAIPAWVFAVQFAAGLLVPLIAAAGPVIRASRMTVRQALQDVGGDPETFGTGTLDAVLARVRWANRLVMLGVRNSFRHRGRMALTLGLLAVAGAMFLTGLDTAKAWSVRLGEVNTSRRYDVAVQFQRPEPSAAALAAVRSVPGVSSAEAWGSATASWGQSARIPVVHTYPDMGHGAFQAVGIPPETKLVSFPVMAGRWLEPGDRDVVVLSHIAAAALPDRAVGRTVTISVDGTPRNWRVVGVVRALGSPATAYIPFETLTRLSNTPGATRTVAVATRPEANESRTDVIRRVERALEESGMRIDIAIPVEMLHTAVEEHMSVVLGLLTALAALMTLVGLLGLTATMTMSVTERTRELGVMQAIGAAPRLVMRVILAEGTFLGLLSGLLAVGLAAPLSKLVGTVIGTLAFRMPLPLVMSRGGIVVWLAAVVILSGAATAAPALRAARLTVREALAYN